MSDIVRVPLHISHPELKKKTFTIPDFPAHKQSSRNVHIRRYPNGTLAFEYIADAVVSALVKLESAADSQQSTCPLTEEEKRIVSLIFPGKFGDDSASLADSTEKMSAEEKNTIRKLVDVRMFGQNPPLRNVNTDDGEKPEFLKGIPEHLKELDSFFARR
jgi:hypothetical protein